MAMAREKPRAGDKPGSTGAGWQSADAASHFGVAVNHHQAGRAREAEQHYRQALAADPTHADSLHLLGVLAHQHGRNDIAVDLIGKALAQDERVPEFHYNIGLAYGALGRFAEAATHNRRAVALRPDYAEAHLNLGNALSAQGEHRHAIASYQQALALRPDSPQAHYNIANAFAETGRTAEAIGHYGQALALWPDYAEAHTNLGATLMTQGNTAKAIEHHRAALRLKPELVTALVNLGNALRADGKVSEATDCYRQACARDPSHAEAQNNLGAALMARDELTEAAACFRRALALKPDLTAAAVNLAKVLIGLGDLETALAVTRRLHEAGETPETRALFFVCLRDSRAAPFATPYRSELIRAITEPWGNPRLLTGLAAALLKADPAIGPLIAAPATPDLRGIDTLAHDALLHAHLTSVQVNDANLERLLTAARQTLLNAADDIAADAVLLTFACALGRQCFINEYVFACSDQEARQARLLREFLVAALLDGATVSAGPLAAAACYAPLHHLPDSHALLARAWPDPVRALLAQQVSEPAQEAGIRAAIPRLTAIGDSVSQAVRTQYEENPYPRWTTTAATSKPQPLDAYLRERFPLAPFRPLGKEQLDYLIAGCGTGQQAADVKLTFKDVSLTAIDLSLASLGYAKRKTDALGLRDIAYGQADILGLGALGKTFDVIDSAGVLHHMAEPLAGWRVLVSLLRPGGVMHIALYSTIARRDITAARRFIAERGWPATADGIRQARQAILALPDGAPEKSVTRIDFFSLSDCRDLLFHVQEHTFGMTDIIRFLSDNALEFLGFEIRPHVARQYAQRFPDDPAKTNLDHWNAFEQENPDTFLTMLQFWVQRRDFPP
jgi:tetratricopeptide (TPR) repeat protein/SAM-dependent methyltransferase